MAPDRGRSHDSPVTEELAKKAKKTSKKKLVRPRGKRGSGASRKRKAGPTGEGAALIGRYHALEKRIHQTPDARERARLRRQQEDEVGGLDGYQRWSAEGGRRDRGGETGKWLVKKLFELEGKREYKLLDVGAIGGTAYASYPWIKPTSIDLNPSPGSSVLQADFFELTPPASEEGGYDVVALSLVVNFVGDVRRRAEMLRRPHLFLRPKRGYVFVALPLACVANSRYLTHDRLKAILATLGWAVVAQDDSRLLTRWLLAPVGDGKGDGRRWKREEVRGGAQRNNFCILV